MRFAKTWSAQNNFLNQEIISVEADISNGLHNFSIIGLGDKAIQESRDRVSSAIKNSGFESPKRKNQKVIISLAPANTKKEGPNFDLSIAVAYLYASGEVKGLSIESRLFIGELSMNGDLKPINGILPLMIKATRSDLEEIIVPEANLKEAKIIDNSKIIGAKSLLQVINHLNGISKIENKKDFIETIIDKENARDKIDFCQIYGHQSIKRGLEIAASGKHNICLYGPAGTGKTMLSKAFVGILPELNKEESIEVTGIHSISGLLDDGEMIKSPPLRSPHHTSSYSSIIGGAFQRPGEITLAHKGVLFLDEFAEFDRRVIDSLRQPLEDKKIMIGRSRENILLPADFILIATMNPCRCGNHGSSTKKCICSQHEIEKYKKKISGPIIDRIDMWIHVPNIDYKNIDRERKIENSDDIRKRVIEIRNRLQNNKIKIPNKSIILLREICQRLQLSMRTYKKILSISKTISHLDNIKNYDSKNNSGTEIKEEHILEALRYRPNE